MKLIRIFIRYTTTKRHSKQRNIDFKHQLWDQSKYFRWTHRNFIDWRVFVKCDGFYPCFCWMCEYKRGHLKHIRIIHNSITTESFKIRFERILVIYVVVAAAVKFYCCIECGIHKVMKCAFEAVTLLRSRAYMFILHTQTTCALHIQTGSNTEG